MSFKPDEPGPVSAGEPEPELFLKLVESSFNPDFEAMVTACAVLMDGEEIGPLRAFGQIRDDFQSGTASADETKRALQHFESEHAGAVRRLLMDTLTNLYQRQGRGR